jgi:hypothetical protein
VQEAQIKRLQAMRVSVSDMVHPKINGKPEPNPQYLSLKMLEP